MTSSPSLEHVFARWDAVSWQKYESKSSTFTKSFVSSTQCNVLTFFARLHSGVPSFSPQTPHGASGAPQSAEPGVGYKQTPPYGGGKHIPFFVYQQTGLTLKVRGWP